MEDYWIPETKEAKSIRLYKWKDDKMVFVKTIIDDIVAVDSTLYYDNNYWWLFSYLQAKNQISSYELHLFSSNKLMGEYKRHPLHPISVDCRCSRPAGKLFTYSNRLYRPSQNNSKGYWYGISINEVTTLNTDDYKENVVDEFLP